MVVVHVKVELREFLQWLVLPVAVAAVVEISRCCVVPWPRVQFSNGGRFVSGGCSVNGCCTHGGSAGLWMMRDGGGFPVSSSGCSGDGGCLTAGAEA